MLRIRYVTPYIHQMFITQLGFVTFPSNSRTLATSTSNVHLQEALLQMAILGPQMEFQGYNAILNDCVSQRATREGQRVHAHMIKTHYLPSVFLTTRLIVFYAKCELLDDAQRVLVAMPERSVVSWTAMISAYSQKGHTSQALTLFLHMLRSGLLNLHYLIIVCLSNYFNSW